jgi:hypothetical protein
MDFLRSKNWIYGPLDSLSYRNPNVVPISASGMKPAISRLVTDSLRFVISWTSHSAPGSFPLVPSFR